MKCFIHISKVPNEVDFIKPVEQVNITGKNWVLWEIYLEIPGSFKELANVPQMKQYLNTHLKDGQKLKNWKECSW